jgi:hypothetical protein
VLTNWAEKSAWKRGRSWMNTRPKVRTIYKSILTFCLVLNHWDDVFKRHGLTSPRSIINAYFHFVVASFPYSYYNCGPSVMARSIYLFVLSWLQTLKSLVASGQKEKGF